MTASKNISEFRNRLEKLQRDSGRRLDEEEWKKVCRKAHEEDEEAAAAAVLDFAQSRKHLPPYIIKAMLGETGLRNHPAYAAEVYGMKIMTDVHDRSVKDDLVDYRSLGSGTEWSTVEDIADTADKLTKYMEKGQIYLSEQAFEKLMSLAPGNPGLKKVRKDLDVIRATGGIPEELTAEDRDQRKAGHGRKDRGTELLRNGHRDEAAAYYEKVISKDFENYEAYYRLGSIYLERGQLSQADYIADLMLDLGMAECQARLLKGRILESRGQKEDALYYYVTAFARDGLSREAFDEMGRLISELDGKKKNFFTAESFTDQQRSTSSEEETYYLSRLEISDQTAETVRETDSLVSRGRVSEAYYELSKASEKYPESSLLTFKKAHALYLMRREAEARNILRSIGRGDALYRRAGWLIKDIDLNIIDNGRFDDMTVTTAAEILFEAGSYDMALAELSKADLASMDAEAWSLKGRCEVENGNMDQALESFKNAVDHDYHVEGVREIMAMIYFVRGDVKKADELYSTAIKLEEHPKRLCGMKAAMLYSQGMVSELLEFRKSSFAILGRTSDADGYAGLALLDADQQSREGAVLIESAILAGTSAAEFYRAAYKVYMNAGMFYRAAVCADAGMARADSTEGMQFYKSCALYRLGKFSSAEMISGMLLANDPEDARVLYLMGRISEASGDTGSAVRWMLDASEKDPENHDYAFSIAEMYYNKAEYDKALVYYTKAISLDSGDSLSYKRRATIYSMMNNDRRALEDINCALLADPEDPDLYILIGNIISGYAVEEYDDMESLDELQEADSEDLEEDAEDQPEAGGSADEEADGSGVEESDAENQPEPDEEGGESEEEDAPADGSDEAEENGEENETEDEKAEEENNAGSDFLNDTEKGPEYYYTRAIELAPDSPDGYVCRAKYYAEHKRMDEALEDADRALEAGGESVKLYMLRGVIRMLAGRDEDAEKDFRRAADIDPANVSAYSYIARCCNSLDKYEEATAAADKGLEIDGNFINLYINRGVAYYKLDRFDDAIGDFDKVLVRRNEVTTSAIETVYRFRGMAYEALEDWEHALSNYRALLRYIPESTGIKKRVADLEQKIEDSRPKSLFSIFRRKK